jgi:hypothetical protein
MLLTRTYPQQMSWFLRDKYRFFLICIDFLYKFAPTFKAAKKDDRFFMANLYVYRSLKHKIINKNNEELSILMTSFNHILKLFNSLIVVRLEKNYLVLRV